MKEIFQKASFFFLLFIFGFNSGEGLFSQDSKFQRKKVKLVKDCKEKTAISSLILNPEDWVNKEVCFEGNFASFSNIALEYDLAYRSKKEYISLLLLRPGTKIPLSELKLTIKISKAREQGKIQEIEQGDKLLIKGKVFSSALGEPWIDISEIEILNK